MNATEPDTLFEDANSRSPSTPNLKNTTSPKLPRDDSYSSLGSIADERKDSSLSLTEETVCASALISLIA